jgi:hypothetical protein
MAGNIPFRWLKALRKGKMMTRLFRELDEMRVAVKLPMIEFSGTWFGGRKEDPQVVPVGSNVGLLLLNAGSGHCLDVPWERELDIVHQWLPHKGVNQQWVLLERADGLIAIISRYKGTCLDVSAQSTDAGAYVHQWEYWGGTNQLWKLEPQPDCTFRITCAHTRMCLDIEGAGTDEGVRPVQFHWHGGLNQRWWVIPAV